MWTSFPWASLIASITFLLGGLIFSNQDMLGSIKRSAITTNKIKEKCSKSSCS